jgi:hypothetical protein
VQPAAPLFAQPLGQAISTLAIARQIFQNLSFDTALSWVHSEFATVLQLALA